MLYLRLWEDSRFPSSAALDLWRPKRSWEAVFSLLAGATVELGSSKSSSILFCFSVGFYFCEGFLERRCFSLSVLQPCLSGIPVQFCMMFIMLIYGRAEHSPCFSFREGENLSGTKQKEARMNIQRSVYATEASEMWNVGLSNRDFGFLPPETAIS